MNHCKGVFLISITAFLLAGCWDSINIEDRGFVVGAAIDASDDQDDSNNPVFSITTQVVLPAGFANPAEATNDQKVFQDITSNQRSVYRINEEMSSLTSKTPYYEHMKVLIISKELAEQEGILIKLLDYYIRDVNIRRSIDVVISEDDAKDILGFKQPENELPAVNLLQLLDHSSDRAGFFKPFNVGNVQETIIYDRSFTLPYLTIGKEVEWKSGAVYQGPEKKMVGTFNESELTGMELFKGEGIQSIIDFELKDDMFGFEVIRIKRKISVDTSNKDHLKIKNDITVRGIIKEAYNKENFSNPDELKEVEAAVSKEIEKIISKATDKAQNELNADVFMIWRELETKHNDTWKQIKDDWESGENLFSKADIDVQVHTDIYSTGTTNKTN